MAVLGFAACTSLPPWGDDPVAIQRRNIASAPRVTGASPPAVRATASGAGQTAGTAPIATAFSPASVPEAAAGPSAYRSPPQTPPIRATSDPAVLALRSRLVEGARSVLGRSSLVVRGRTFGMDCTGLVLAVYWYAGVDLAKSFDRYDGNGVSRLYQELHAKNLLYSTESPLSGDLIFWDNTYDENSNGRWDDPLTHVGMVVSVDADGTITYLHYHDRKGISLDSMNLANPAVYQQTVGGVTKTLNSPLRLVLPGEPRPDEWLSGQLYRSMGMGYLVQ